MFDIAKYNYFASGNVFTGSKETFNYRIVKEDDRLTFAVWYGLLCYEKSDIVSKSDFAAGADGLAEGITWLEEEYKRYQKDGT